MGDERIVLLHSLVCLTHVSPCFAATDFVANRGILPKCGGDERSACRRWRARLNLIAVIALISGTGVSSNARSRVYASTERPSNRALSRHVNYSVAPPLSVHPS